MPKCKSELLNLQLASYIWDYNYACNVCTCYLLYNICHLCQPYISKWMIMGMLTTSSVQNSKVLHQSITVPLHFKKLGLIVLLSLFLKHVYLKIAFICWLLAITQRPYLFYIINLNLLNFLMTKVSYSFGRVSLSWLLELSEGSFHCHGKLPIKLKNNLLNDCTRLYINISSFVEQKESSCETPHNFHKKGSILVLIVDVYWVI